MADLSQRLAEAISYDIARRIEPLAAEIVTLRSQMKALSLLIKNPHQHLVKSPEWLEPVWTTAEVTGLDRETTPPSFAPTPGPVRKPSESYTETPDAPGESPQETHGRILQAIMACFRSTPSTERPLVTISHDFSTLQLTLRWPTESGQIKAGDPGDAGREMNEY